MPSKHSIRLLLIFFVLLPILSLTVLCMYVQAVDTNKSHLAQGLWEEGEKAFKAEDYRTALKNFDASLSIYREIGDQQSEADLLTWKAVIKVETNNLFDALNYLKDSQIIFNKLAGRPGEKALIKSVDKAITALLMVIDGAKYRDNKDYDSALKKYNNALQIVKDMGERKYEANLLSSIGQLYIDIGENEHALKYFNEAKKIYRELGKKAEEAKMLSYVGLISGVLNRYEQSLESYDRALRIYSDLGDNFSELSLLLRVGITYAKLKNDEKSKEYFSRAINKGKFFGHKTIIKGLDFNDSGDYEKALQEFELALNIFEQIGTEKEIADAIGVIGVAQSSLKHFQLALDYFLQALKIYRKIGDNRYVNSTLIALGRTHLDLQNHEKALEYFQESLELSKELNDLKSQGDSLAWLGSVYSHKGEHVKAIEYFKEALLKHKTINDKEGEAEDYFQIGGEQFVLENYTEAKEYLIKFLTMSESLNHKKQKKIAMAHSALAIYHGYIGNHNEAIRHLQESLRINQASNELESTVKHPKNQLSNHS